MLEINIIAVLVATIVSVAVATVWYSSLVFGPAWLRAVGRTDADASEEGKRLWVRLAISGAIHFVGLAALAHLLSLPNALLEQPPFAALCTIAVVVLAFCAGIVLWERKSLSYFFINGTYLTLAIVAGGAIVVYWPW